MLSAELKQSLISIVKAVEALNDPATSFLSWCFHDSGSVNSCLNCEGRDGKVYKVVDPADLLLIFPFGVFVADDTFAVNLHPHCACYLILES